MSENKLIVDIALLKKYDRSGPRYTSYPTAPYFQADTGPGEYLNHITRPEYRRDSRDISVYFHLPFCDTLCYFCGCNMLVTRRPERIDEYIDYLTKEIKLLKPQLNPERRIAQMHWGGGTPTSLSPAQIRRLGEAIHRHFNFAEQAEVSVEIDPRELTRDHLAALREIGFSRCSMGVQDFDPAVQKAVNRIQPEQITRQAVDWARELEFESVNVDLMYGLPFQTLDKFDYTLDRVLAFDPDRFAVFNYAHLPAMIKHQRLIKEETIPSPEIKLNLLKLSIEKLTASGYVYIGMDHFAKPDDELTLAMNNGTLHRNFQGYSTYAGLDLFALGMSSISLLPDLYVQNEKKLKLYYEKLDRGQLPVMRGYKLSADDQLRRNVIMELMCNFKLAKTDIESRYGIVFDDYFADALDELTVFEQDALVRLSKNMIEVTPHGRLLIRNIAMNFDAYLNDQGEKGPSYSRTV